MSNVVALQTTPRTLTAKAGERLASSEEESALSRLAELKDLVEAAEAERKSLTEWLISQACDDKPIRSSAGKASIVNCKGRESTNVEAMVMARPDLAEVVAQFTKVGAPYSYIRLGR
jgi:hypothetical protein